MQHMPYQQVICGQNEGWILRQKLCPSRYADFVVKYDQIRNTDIRNLQSSASDSNGPDHFWICCKKNHRLAKKQGVKDTPYRTYLTYPPEINVNLQAPSTKVQPTLRKRSVPHHPKDLSKSNAPIY